MIGNRNAQTSGVRTQTNLTMRRFGLQLSRLPEGCRYIHGRASELRNALERAVMAERAVITIPELSIVAVAASWLIHGMLGGPVVGPGRRIPDRQ